MVDGFGAQMWETSDDSCQLVLPSTHQGSFAAKLTADGWVHSMHLCCIIPSGSVDLGSLLLYSFCAAKDQQITTYNAQHRNLAQPG